MDCHGKIHPQFFVINVNTPSPGQAPWAARYSDLEKATIRKDLMVT